MKPQQNVVSIVIHFLQFKAYRQGFLLILNFKRFRAKVNIRKLEQTVESKWLFCSQFLLFFISVMLFILHRDSLKGGGLISEPRQKRMHRDLKEKRLPVWESRGSFKISAALDCWRRLEPRSRFREAKLRSRASAEAEGRRAAFTQRCDSGS